MSWRILTVDDDRAMRHLLRVAFQAKGFEVSEAPDGKAAVEHALDSRPHLILMDVMMPRMDGFTACQLLRRTDSTAHIPIILLSALTSAEDKKKGLESGANLYLTKPMARSALIQTVFEILKDSHN